MSEKEAGEEGAGPDVAATEAEARSMGWVEKDRFHGPEDKWVDAAKFVERGHTILPIVQATNRKLLTANEELKRQLDTVVAGEAELRASIKEMQGFHEENLKEQVARVKVELRAQLVAAKKEGDVEREVEIEEKLADLRDAGAKVKREEAKPEPAAKKTDAPAEDPEFNTWRTKPENAWFGSDRKKTAMALEFGRDVQAERTDLFDAKGMPTAGYYLEVGKRVAAFFDDTPRRPDKVGGSRSSGSKSSATRGYDDMPSEAKDTCKSFESKLVGPNKVHKTAESFRAAYAKTYFISQEA